MNTASQNIRYLRRKYQFTQEQMAQKLGIKRSLLGAYEEARANPRLEVLVKAAELFNVSVDQLVSKPLDESVRRSSPRKQEERFTSGRPPSSYQSPTHYPPLSETLGSESQEEYPQEPEENHDFSDYEEPAERAQKRPYLPPRKITFKQKEDTKKLKSLRLVLRDEFRQYFYNAVDAHYLEGLPELRLFLPNTAAPYRAFEVVDDAMQPIHQGATVVGRRVDSLQKVQDGKPHVLVTRTEGVLFRRVFNHISRSGNLLLEANNSAYERISLPVLGKEIEAWEFVMYLSEEDPYQLTASPNASSSSMDLPRLTSIVMELQQEVMRLKEKL